MRWTSGLRKLSSPSARAMSCSRGSPTILSAASSTGRTRGGYPGYSENAWESSHWNCRPRRRKCLNLRASKRRTERALPFNYYGVSGNAEMLKRFYEQSCRTVFKWLNRRTQKKSCNWQGFREMLAHFKVPLPRIIGYWE